MSKKKPWPVRVEELRVFAVAHRRMPLAAIEAERPLETWVRLQRRRFDRLSESKRQELSAIPHFSFAPRDDLWEGTLRGVLDFAAAHGRPPRRHATDDPERALGIWWGKQRWRAGTGDLGYERLTAVRSALAVIAAIDD